jgi:hypothetical protein
MMTTFLATTALVLCTLPATAEDFVVDVVENTQNGGNVLDGGDNLTITGSGRIETPVTDAVSGTNGNSVFNDGVIIADSVDSRGINLVDGINTVVNRGVVQMNGAFGNAIRIFGEGGTIENFGLVQTTDLGANAVVLIGAGGQMVNAVGAIIVTGGDGSTAIQTTGDVDIRNAGQIGTLGNDAGGIDLAGTGQILNEGLIDLKKRPKTGEPACLERLPRRSASRPLPAPLRPPASLPAVRR